MPALASPVTEIPALVTHRLMSWDIPKSGEMSVVSRVVETSRDHMWWRLAFPLQIQIQLCVVFARTQRPKIFFAVPASLGKWALLT